MKKKECRHWEMYDVWYSEAGVKPMPPCPELNWYSIHYKEALEHHWKGSARGKMMQLGKRRARAGGGRWTERRTILILKQGDPAAHKRTIDRVWLHKYVVVTKNLLNKSKAGTIFRGENFRARHLERWKRGGKKKRGERCWVARQMIGRKSIE